MQIIYFDGECNLCNRFVDFLIRRDRRRVYRYSTLQGSTAAVRLPPALRGSTLTTVVFEKEGVFSTESSAAIQAVAGLGGVYTLILLFYMIPRPVRDALYRWISRNRYRWFGKRARCRIATQEERELFL